MEGKEGRNFGRERREGRYEGRKEVRKEGSYEGRKEVTKEGKEGKEVMKEKRKDERT